MSAAAGFREPGDGAMGAGDRLVPLEGTFNFRDLGGYPTAGGRHTEWGVLYRSDGLQSLTAEDVGALRRRGLATVVDLRTPAELERWGRGPLAGEPVHYEHLTVIREDAGESLAAPVSDDLAERYMWYLEIGGEAFARALRLAADPARVPLVFHCAAGKDRTGVLAAVILDIAGVPADVIVADYVATGAHLDAILHRLARGVDREQLERVPASRLSVEASTMQSFLERLHDRYGGADRWAVQAGVPASTVERLRSILVGG